MRIALAVAVSFTLAAQDDPRFESQSRLVLVPVTVTDAQGKTVDGLEASDFVVLDNGRPQRSVVDTFVTGVAPIALVVAVQSSGISAAALAKVQKIGAMIQPLITGERGCAAVVAFDEDLRWLQECTPDPDALERAFGGLRIGAQKRGRMLDAAYEAIAKLRAKPNVRRVLLLISESKDRGSERELEPVVIAAEAAGVTIYAATYSAYTTPFTARAGETPPAGGLDILGGIAELGRLGKTKATDVLTARTGGATLPFTRLRGLENAIERLGQELHTQYLLSFTPEDAAPGFHRIEVRARGREGLRIRSRPGYWTGSGI